MFADCVCVCPVVSRALVLKNSAGSIVACANIRADSPSADQTFPKVGNFSRSDVNKMNQKKNSQSVQ